MAIHLYSINAKLNNSMVAEELNHTSDNSFLHWMALLEKEVWRIAGASVYGLPTTTFGELKQLHTTGINPKDAAQLILPAKR